MIKVFRSLVFLTFLFFPYLASAQVNNIAVNPIPGLPGPFASVPGPTEACRITKCNGTIVDNEGYAYYIAKRCPPDYRPPAPPGHNLTSISPELGFTGWYSPSCDGLQACPANDGCLHDIATKPARCGAGFGKFLSDGKCHRLYFVDVSKNNCCDINNGSNPIHTASGNKLQTERDFIISTGLGIYFDRYYTSDIWWEPGALGQHWRHSLMMNVLGSQGADGSKSAAVFRSNGNIYRFVKSGQAWLSEPDVSGRLTATEVNGQITEWNYTEDGRIHEFYDASGNLVRISSGTGNTLTLIYTNFDPTDLGHLTQIIDEKGRQWLFSYNDKGLVSSILLPDGSSYAYDYDGDPGILRHVSKPSIDSSGQLVQNVREYIYGEGDNAQPYQLTGIVDENGSRYATWQYDGTGRAWLSVHGAANSTIDRVELSYSDQSNNRPPATVTVKQWINGDTNSISQRNYTFALLYGVTKYATMDSPCPMCGDDNSQERDYDNNGYLSSSTDFNGVKTLTSYNASGLLEKRIESANTPAQRTTNTSWDLNLRVPLSRSVIDAAGTEISRTSWVYNSSGLVLARCDVDPAQAAAATFKCQVEGPAPAGVRRIVNHYCDALDTTQCPLIGLLLSVDGPRNDVNDITRYSYYLSTDETGCGTLDGACHRVGDLYQIIDALGHATTAAAYDKAGRLTRQINRAGVLTDYAYTPRGWLKSRTVRGATSEGASTDATTAIDYDAVGNVIKVTDPDGVSTRYTYDVAHRLTDITDALGNTMHYTLDALGDKTAGACQDFCVLSHTLPAGQGRTYGKEELRAVLGRAA